MPNCTVVSRHVIIHMQNALTLVLTRRDPFFKRCHHVVLGEPSTDGWRGASFAETVSGGGRGVAFCELSPDSWRGVSFGDSSSDG